MLFNQLPRIASNYVLEMRLDKFELRIRLRILDIPMNRTLNGRGSLNEIELETDHSGHFTTALPPLTCSAHAQ